MTYASKELKTKVVGLIKDQAKAKDIKITLNTKIVNYSTLKVNISACSIDLRTNLIQTLNARLDSMKQSGCYGVNEYETLEKALADNTNRTDENIEYYGLSFSTNYLDRYFTGEALNLVEDILKSIKCDFYDNSNPMVDYFDTAYYWDLSIGKNKGGFVHKS